MFLIAFAMLFFFLPTAANSPLALVLLAFFLLKFMTTDCAIPGKIYRVRQKLSTNFFAWGLNWQDASWLWSGIWCRAVHKQMHLANTWVTPKFPSKALSPVVQSFPWSTLTLSPVFPIPYVCAYIPVCTHIYKFCCIRSDFQSVIKKVCIFIVKGFNVLLTSFILYSTAQSMHSWLP